MVLPLKVTPKFREGYIMASSGNTWFKKLQNKQRLNTLKVLGVKSRFAVEKASQLEPSDDHRSFRRQPRRFGSVKV